MSTASSPPPPGSPRPQKAYKVSYTARHFRFNLPPRRNSSISSSPTSAPTSAPHGPSPPVSLPLTQTQYVASRGCTTRASPNIPSGTLSNRKLILYETRLANTPNPRASPAALPNPVPHPADPTLPNGNGRSIPLIRTQRHISRRDLLSQQYDTTVFYPVKRIRRLPAGTR